MRIAISTEDCTEDELQAYIDLGVREGWSDPVGFALNRLFGFCIGLTTDARNPFAHGWFPAP